MTKRFMKLVLAASILTNVSTATAAGCKGGDVNCQFKSGFDGAVFRVDNGKTGDSNAQIGGCCTATFAPGTLTDDAELDASGAPEPKRNTNPGSAD